MEHPGMVGELELEKPEMEEPELAPEGKHWKVNFEG